MICTFLVQATLFRFSANLFYLSLLSIYLYYLSKSSRPDTAETFPGYMHVEADNGLRSVSVRI